MKKVRLTESELITLIKRVIKEDEYEPDVDDAINTIFRANKRGDTGKNMYNKRYISFDGQQFTQEDIEFADYQDLGELPRIENGKLIIANPAWSL